MSTLDEKIQLVIKLLDLTKIESDKCADCDKCRTAKTLMEKAIVLSAEIVADQAMSNLKNKQSVNPPAEEQEDKFKKN